MGSGDVFSALGGLGEQAFRREQAQSDRERLSDQKLIMTAGDPGNAMELQRRLKVAVETLTTELVAFRASSDAASRKLVRLTNWLIGFTVGLVLLTLVLVYLAWHPVGASISHQPQPTRSAASQRRSASTPVIAPRPTGVTPAASSPR
jgi:hypothetical protein